eukprot:1976742-Karenia_brevis.AAC.1
MALPQFTDDPIQSADPWASDRQAKAPRCASAPMGQGPIPASSTGIQPGPLVGGSSLQAMLDAHALRVQQQTAQAISGLNSDLTESTQALLTDVHKSLTGHIRQVEGK